jgi:type I restriction enzyme, S subunit
MENKKKIPELRFEGFTEDWISSKLGDIGDVKMCKRIFNNQTADDGDIPFYKIGTFGKKADAFISKELYKEFKEKYSFPKKGDILISAAGTLGRTVVYDGNPAYFQDSNIVWINNDESKVLNEFLLYVYERITYESEGGTIQRLYNSIILNAKFSYPSSKESQKLVLNFFKNIDELITKHQKKHNRLITLKKSMLEKMFPKEGQTVPEIRFNGFDGDWGHDELQNFGKSYTGLSGKTKKDFGQGDAKYITYMNVFSNSIGDPSLTGLIESDNTQNCVEYGDVLFTVSSETPEEVGLTSVWTQNEKNVYLNSFCFGYRPTKRFDVTFLANALRSSAFRKKIILLGQGISRFNISKTKVMNLELCYPNFDEQVKIGLYFKDLDSLISNHQNQLQKLKNFKQSLSEKMFV